jgi:hypothetical protein
METMVMQHAEMPPASTVTHATNRDLTTPPGSPGRNSWPGWAKSFHSSALGCGGDVRPIAFITEPGPIRKILTHLGEPPEPPVSLSRLWPARRLGRARPGPRRPGNRSGMDRRSARHRHPQPLTAFRATVRSAREKRPDCCSSWSSLLGRRLPKRHWPTYPCLGGKVLSFRAAVTHRQQPDFTSPAAKK